MRTTNAREGQELVGQHVDMINILTYDRRSRRHQFARAYIESEQIAPHRHTAERNPLRGKIGYRYVFVTTVKGQIPGVAFCAFREIEQRDINANAQVAQELPFVESISFSRVEDDNLVLTYQAALEAFNALGRRHAGEMRELRITPKTSARIERRKWADSEVDGSCGWNFSTRRSHFDALGGSKATRPAWKGVWHL